mgnify:CR=1 FL=1|tara:strand:- start:216 stop:635 length:420 start_codon:yes stop_codon:yes gene_type:complete
MLYANNIPNRRKVKKIANTSTIDVADCGTEFLISAMNAGAYTITLPTLANAGPGWHCTITNFDADASLGQVVTIAADSGDGSKIANNFLDDDVYASEEAGNDLKFAASSLKGEYMEIFTDGEFWYIRALSSVNGGFATS